MLGENERIELKLMRQLKRAMGLEFKSEAINWEKLTTSISEIRQVPSHLNTKPSIFKVKLYRVFLALLIDLGCSSRERSCRFTL